MHLVQLQQLEFASHMPARKSEFYDGTTHCDKGISDQEFIESIKKELGEEPKQQELF